MKTTVEEIHLQSDDHRQMEDQYREQMERLEADKVCLEHIQHL